MPDVAVDLLEGDADLPIALVEEAQLDLLGDLGEDGEVGPDPVEGGAKGVGPARPEGDGLGAAFGAGCRHGKCLVPREGRQTDGVGTNERTVGGGRSGRLPLRRP